MKSVFGCVAAVLVIGRAFTAFAAPALREGLVVHLPFTNDLQDHAAKPQPVEVHGPVSVREGAAYFEGKQNWLDLPFIPLNDRPFAVAMWLKPTGAEPTYGVLLQWDRNQESHIFHLMIRDGLRPWFGFYINDVVSPVSLSNAGEWQHLLFQYDGVSQQIWIGGRLICQRAAKAYQGAKGRTLIGKNADWTNVPAKDYEGWMSDFRIYERTLAFEEITALAGAVPVTKFSASTPRALSPQPPGSVAPPGFSAAPLLKIDAEKMRLRGKPGEEYVVEASKDLVAWEVIGNVTVGEDGAVDFVDEEAARFRQRFYRIRYRLP